MKPPIDDAYRVLAAGAVRKHAKALARHVAGIPDGDDPEHVHQARVASRRLRAALSAFGHALPRKKVKRWRKAVQRLTRGLGPVRDADVQLAFFSGVLDGTGSKRLRPGLERLALRLRQQRERLGPAGARAARRPELAEALDEMRATTQRLIARHKKNRPQLDGPAMRRRGAGAIAERLDAVLADAACLEDPDAVARHHALRIEAKRLRYTLELLRPVGGAPLKDLAARIHPLQTLLGEVHDADVRIDLLDDFLVEESARTRAYYGHTRAMGRLRPGIDHLRARLARERVEWFEKLVAAWREVEADGTWDRLRTVMDAPPAEAKPPTPEPAEAERDVSRAILALGATEETEAPAPAEPPEPPGGAAGPAPDTSGARRFAAPSSRGAAS